MTEKSSFSLMLNTITFNTSCKPKLLHWRGTPATKCPTIFLNKHANVCVGPPFNLSHISTLFSVVELACGFEIKTTTGGGAGCIAPAWMPVQHPGTAPQSGHQKHRSWKVCATSSFFPPPLCSDDEWGHITHPCAPCTLKCCPLSSPSNSAASSWRARCSRTSVVHLICSLKWKWSYRPRAVVEWESQHLQSSLILLSSHCTLNNSPTACTRLLELEFGKTV